MTDQITQIQIKTLKEDIAILQEKLNKLEEIEKHNAIPRMNFLFDGKFEVVSYNKKSYYRLEFPDEVYWYRRTSHETYLDLKLERITDGETHRLLEGVWYNDVEVKREKKGFQPKPQSPEEVAEGLRDAMRQAKEEGVFDVVDEPEYYDEVEWDIDENKKKPNTLYNIIDRWWCDIFGGIHNDWDMETSIEDLCDRIQLWILRNKK